MLMLVDGCKGTVHDQHSVLPKKFAQAGIHTSIQQVPHSNFRQDASHPDAFHGFIQARHPSAGILP
jgi:hypothetical protein